MKATGIVRRIDDLGRVVIPKEIRRTLRIREGEPLEIFTENNGEVIFKKYSPMGEMASFAAQLCESLNKTAGQPVIICDRDTVIAAAGNLRKELTDKKIAPELEQLMEGRQHYQLKQADKSVPVIEGNPKYFISTASPVISEGDITGCVAFVGIEGAPLPGESESKLVQAVAGFLSRQMEP